MGHLAEHTVVVAFASAKRCPDLSKLMPGMMPVSIFPYSSTGSSLPTGSMMWKLPCLKSFEPVYSLISMFSPSTTTGRNTCFP